uniref:Cilia- and flagella-associated protein 52 n=1 Tax=Glossina brevipalpis TaxID=37001 RepID=A0A1A9X516_9MUSC
MTEAVQNDVEVEKLKCRAIFGFNGKVNFGLHLHPDGRHLIFPLGTKIGIDDIKTSTQEFIAGHTNNLSCLDLSRSGKYMASGQINHMGFPAYVILWDFGERRELARHDLHKVRAQSVCFTSRDKYIISIGGRDDGSVIVFDIETRTPICRSVASRGINGDPEVVRALNNNSSFFVTAGDRHLRLWSIQREMKKVNVQDVFMGKQQRRMCCVGIYRGDEYAYMGTYSGDLMKVALNCCDVVNVTHVGQTSGLVGAYGIHNPRKPFGKDCNRYVHGVRVVRIVDDGLLLVGAGDGVVELVEERKDINEIIFKNYPNPTYPMLKMLKRTKVNGAVSSLVEINPLEYYIATDLNEIYLLNIKTFSLKLLKTSHKKAVYSIVFPRNLSNVFATAGYETIRVWSTKRLQELLRIMVYNFNCAALAFSYDGTSIVSAWNDGVIRSFTPITGRLIYAIPNAHNKGCSALAISSTGHVLVTGGIEGQVRVWKIEPCRQSLLGVLKDHSAPITTLDFNKFDTEVISASSDGSCVIWDIKRLTRKTVVAANTQFMTAKYFPTGVQFLTCGTDGCISYWMVYNGSLIRELQASKKSSVNHVAINATGDYFASVGSDQMVKLWDYNSGVVVAQGHEHASAVISVAYSPSRKFFVTGCTDGAIIVWDVPEVILYYYYYVKVLNVKFEYEGFAHKFWGQENPPPSIKEPVVEEKPKPKAESQNQSQLQLKSSRSNTSKTENIEGLVSNTPKNNVCCVECPPITATIKKGTNENCNIVPDVKKC